MMVLFDKLVGLEPIDEAGGSLVLPDSVKSAVMFRYAWVRLVGLGVTHDVKVGDKVYYVFDRTLECESDGKKYVVVSQDSLIGKVVEGGAGGSLEGSLDASDSPV